MGVRSLKTGLREAVGSRGGRIRGDMGVNFVAVDASEQAGFGFLRVPTAFIREVSTNLRILRKLIRVVWERPSAAIGIGKPRGLSIGDAVQERLVDRNVIEQFLWPKT